MTTVDRVVTTRPKVQRVQDPQQDSDVGAFDRRVYRALAAYAFDEPVCHPSQQLIAYEVGCARETVNRAVQRLVEARWLLVWKRWCYRSRWCHNVYELLAPFAVSPLAAKRIVRRAHRRARRAARKRAFAGTITLTRRVGLPGVAVGAPGAGRMEWRVQRPPPLPGSTCERGSDEWLRWRYGEQRAARMVRVGEAVEARRVERFRRLESSIGVPPVAHDHRKVVAACQRWHTTPRNRGDGPHVVHRSGSRCDGRARSGERCVVPPGHTPGVLVAQTPPIPNVRNGFYARRKLPRSTRIGSSGQLPRIWLYTAILGHP